MGFYSRYIFPYILDHLLSPQYIMQQRRRVLQPVRGKILEIGFGTGLNLSCYPEEVKEITTLDTNQGMNRFVAKRIAASPIRVEHALLNAEKLPFADDSFDSVVSTWTLCSIKNIDQALQEIYRILKPSGSFYFLEHGLSNEPNIQDWQRRLNPIQKLCGDGCHLDRNIREILLTQKYKLPNIEEFYIPQMPKIFGYMYAGIATK